MDIIYRPVFHLKHVVSETGFSLHLQVEPTQSSSETEISCFYWAYMCRLNFNMETESSLRNVVF
jgi:hypothetical protein